MAKSYYHRNHYIELMVRGGLGDTFIVARYDRSIDKWASPIKFRPIPACATRKGCQQKLDEYAKQHGLEPVEGR